MMCPERLDSGRCTETNICRAAKDPVDRDEIANHSNPTEALSGPLEGVPVRDIPSDWDLLGHGHYEFEGRSVGIGNEQDRYAPGADD
jgi:hypothetical protein